MMTSRTAITRKLVIWFTPISFGYRMLTERFRNRLCPPYLKNNRISQMSVYIISSVFNGYGAATSSSGDHCDRFTGIATQGKQERIQFFILCNKVISFTQFLLINILNGFFQLASANFIVIIHCSFPFVKRLFAFFLISRHFGRFYSFRKQNSPILIIYAESIKKVEKGMELLK